MPVKSNYDKNGGSHFGIWQNVLVEEKIQASSIYLI